jgi:type I restriction enzyme S subunit
MVTNWESVLLEDVATIGDGLHGTPLYDENGEYFFINGNNLRNGRITTDENTKHVNERTYESLRIDFSPRTVFMSINGTIGNAACFHGERIAIGKSVAYFNVNSAILPNYLFFQLQTNQLLKYFEEALTGSTIRNLGLNVIRKAKIPLPPLPEQRAIAAALSDADAYITALEKLIAKKRAVKQGAMQELLTGKRRLPGFEGEWVTFELERIADLYDNLRVPITESLRESGQIPYYGANGIQDYVKGYTHDGEFVLIAEDGANDLSNYPVRYVKGKIWVNNHAHVLQGKAEKADTRFLAYGMSILDYQAILVGGTRAKLNGSVLKRITVSLPDKDEQTAIAAVLSDMDAEIDLLTAKLEKARCIKQGMMSELLTGRIRLIKEDTHNGEN